MLARHDNIETVFFAGLLVAPRTDDIQFSCRILATVSGAEGPSQSTLPSDLSRSTSVLQLSSAHAEELMPECIYTVGKDYDQTFLRATIENSCTRHRYLPVNYERRVCHTLRGGFQKPTLTTAFGHPSAKLRASCVTRAISPPVNYERRVCHTHIVHYIQPPKLRASYVTCPPSANYERRVCHTHMSTTFSDPNYGRRVCRAISHVCKLRASCLSGGRGARVSGAAIAAFHERASLRQAALLANKALGLANDTAFGKTTGVMCDARDFPRL